VTLYRAICRERRAARRRPGTARVKLGLQRERFEGARLFVLPNPSGRNANFTYAEMLDAFVRLRRWSLRM